MRLILFFSLIVLSHSHRLSSWQEDVDRNIVYHFGTPNAGSTWVVDKEGTLTRDRKKNNVLIEPVECYEIKYIVVKVTYAKNMPSVQLNLINQKLVVTFIHAFGKVGSQPFTHYQISAKGDRRPDCVEVGLRRRDFVL